MADVFHFVEKPYNKRNSSTLKRRCNYSVYFSIDSVCSLALKISRLVPNAIKNTTSLELLKKIKFWTTDKCPCKHTQAM